MLLLSAPRQLEKFLNQWRFSVTQARQLEGHLRRWQTLSELDTAAYAGGGSRYGGYRSLKGLITQSYFASEDGALQERGWVAVPGRWDPCVDIES